MSKKAAKSQKEQHSYQLHDVVLAKIRGFPPWPGIIVDPSTAPENVLKERPSLKKGSQTVATKTTYHCVRFFPAGDYAWLVAKDISKLQKHEIEAYIGEPYKKNADLLTGYQIALDPTKWEEERQAAALEAEEETANAEVDQLASEEEDADGKKSKSKKRKRESEAPSKSKAKKGSDEPAARKKATGTKGRKGGTKSKNVVESEDDGDHEADEGENVKGTRSRSKKSRKDKDEDEFDATVSNDPEAKKVREWRHQLQKTFLSGKTQPKDENMTTVDALFTSIEQYDKMNITYLQFSKIGKVMRHITALPPEKLRRDSEFNFRQRASALMDRWHQILSANKLHNGNAPDVPANVDLDAQQINGKSPEVQAEQPAAETAEKDTADAPVQEAAPMPVEVEA